MIITFGQVKKPIKENVTVRYFEVKTGTLSRYGWVADRDTMDWDNEQVVRFPKDECLFKTVLSFGGSGAKEIKYFKYVGDVQRYVQEEYPKLHANMDYNDWEKLGVSLTKLMDGKIKRLTVNNRDVKEDG